MSPGLTCQAGHSSGLVVTPFTSCQCHVPVSQCDQRVGAILRAHLCHCQHLPARSAAPHGHSFALLSIPILPHPTSPAGFLRFWGEEDAQPSPDLCHCQLGDRVLSSGPAPALGQTPGVFPLSRKSVPKGCTPDFQTRGCALLPSGTHGPVVEMPKKWQHPEPLSQVAAVAPPCPARAKGAPEPCRGTLPFTNP